MNVICGIFVVVGKVNKKMWYSVTFSVKKPKKSGDVLKYIGRCSKMHREAFEKNSGGILKNLGRFLGKPRDVLFPP